MTKLLFQKFFAVECGILGVCSILYAVAALLGWKYARPRRWWDWEPAKNYIRKNAPAYMLLGIFLCYVSHLPFLDTEQWTFLPAVYLAFLAALILCVGVSAAGGKNFQVATQTQGMWSTSSSLSRRLDTAGLVLVIFSNIFDSSGCLRPLMLQIGLLLMIITSVIDYLAPPDKPEENSRA